MEREDIPDFKMNIDENLKDDTKIKIDDNEFTYKDIKDIIPSFRKQEPIKCLIYWDDICQLTSLGLMEVINSVCKSDAKIDIEHFLSRTNEYSYGIKYVFKLYEKVLSKEDISRIKRKFYWKIMQISLKTSLFHSITRIDNYFDKMGFYFPFPFEHCDELKAEFRNMYFKNRTGENLQFYYASDNVGLNDIMKRDSYNVIITPNIVQAYDYIIKNDLKRITIIGPDAHNGVDDELYNMFYKFRRLPKPNYCEVTMYHEQIVM
ncbi:MAG: hypothetical protein K2N99_00655 [Malacoplasma sp.]|nr:hypothetical protein [Malacoplasma sp.]